MKNFCFAKKIGGKNWVSKFFQEKFVGLDKSDGKGDLLD
jgi:hypothetical protein